MWLASSRPSLVCLLHCRSPGRSRTPRGWLQSSRATAKAFGTPKYLITDLGGEFQRADVREGRRAARNPPALRLRPEHPRHRPARTLLANPQGHREPSSPSSLSPSRTWSEGSRPRSRTTSSSARTRGSAVRHQPRPSSEPTRPARRPYRLREDAPARDQASRPSPSSTSIRRTNASQSSGKPPSRLRKNHVC